MHGSENKVVWSADHSGAVDVYSLMTDKIAAAAHQRSHSPEVLQSIVKDFNLIHDIW